MPLFDCHMDKAGTSKRKEDVQIPRILASLPTSLASLCECYKAQFENHGLLKILHLYPCWRYCQERMGNLCSLWYRKNIFSKEYKILKYRSTNEEIDFFQREGNISLNYSTKLVFPIIKSIADIHLQLLGLVQRLYKSKQ